MQKLYKQMLQHSALINIHPQPQHDFLQESPFGTPHSNTMSPLVTHSPITTTPLNCKIECLLLDYSSPNCLDYKMSPSHCVCLFCLLVCLWSDYTDYADTIGARNKNWQAFLCGSSHSHTTPRQCKNIPSFITEPSWHMCGHAHTPRLTLCVSQTLRPWFWYTLPCHSHINGNGVSWTHKNDILYARQRHPHSFHCLTSCFAEPCSGSLTAMDDFI